MTALEQNIKARFADDYFGDRAQGEGRNTDMFRQAISDVGHLLAVVDGLRRELSTVATAGGAALQQLYDGAQREVIPSNLRSRLLELSNRLRDSGHYTMPDQSDLADASLVDEAIAALPDETKAESSVETSAPPIDLLAEICSLRGELELTVEHKSAVETELGKARQLLENWMLAGHGFDIEAWATQVRNFLEDSNPFQSELGQCTKHPWSKFVAPHGCPFCHRFESQCTCKVSSDEKSIQCTVYADCPVHGHGGPTYTCWECGTVDEFSVQHEELPQEGNRVVTMIECSACGFKCTDARSETCDSAQKSGEKPLTVSKAPQS